MKKMFLMVAILLLAAALPAFAASSAITEAEGYSCMGYDKSRKATEDDALANARRQALEYASTYVKSATTVEDATVLKDLLEAYANGTVRILQELQRTWYTDPKTGECFRIKVKAEVLPDSKAMDRVAAKPSLADDPGAPLNVRVWTDKKTYRQAEQIRIFLRGNRPFFARVIYRDTKGQVLQLLPNPYRTDNYFQGGVIYEIPSGNDRFQLEVVPPFGEEKIMVYASSSPIGDLQLEAAGPVYEVRTKAADMAVKVRGVNIVKTPAKNAKPDGPGGGAGFFEASATLRTNR
ncbi:MAG: hypothetical protein CVU61_02790 [Deltaproteobacteria bacterium HGW-Deltaproteobacteria-19]|jgi:hypothetical protein|nr:MAG: hypothetical protein CVU61_02790 [Deltaproteobacteria bacterium HGW-Deltaproteobacteria-19]